MNYNDTEINAAEESSIADISVKQAEVVDCYEQHKRAFDRWRFGKPVKSWKDDQGNLCIKYESGIWFHYKTNSGVFGEKPYLEWW